MSRYLNPHIALERLRAEWKKYGKIIVAYDVDSTVIPYHADEADDNYELIRQLLRDLKLLGCTLIVFTAASEERWEWIKIDLKNWNIPWDYFNQSPPNIPSIVEKGKVYANAYLDDRAGLHEVFMALSWLVAERKRAISEDDCERIRAMMQSL